MQNNFDGYQNKGNNMNFNQMFNSSTFPNNQNNNNGRPNMNQNNNYNLQNSNANNSLVQSQQIPINNNMKKLFVQLNQEEQMFYSKLYNLLDPNGSGRILGKIAANFMKRSNLKKEVLKEIWLIAAQNSNQFILKEEFFVALRLIALAQNNMPFTAQSIEMNNPIPPLANFDMTNLQNEVNNKMNNMNNNQQNNNNNNQKICEISQKEEIFFKNIFDNKKEPNEERITAHNSIILWKSNNADDGAIRIVANIIKPLEKKGFLNLKEFIVACHLINLSKKTSLPQRLPDYLVNYLGRNNNNNFNNNNLNSGKNMTDYGLSRINTNQNVSQFLNESSFISQNKNSLNNFMSNNSNNNGRIQEILKKEEVLTKKNNILNNQINEAKNKINDLLKEIELIQKRQDNINSEISSLRQEINRLENNNNNGSPNNNNNFDNKKSEQNISMNFVNTKSNNLDNPLIKKNLENIGKNMRYDSSDLNNENKDFAKNNPQENRGDYPELNAKKSDNLMNLMDKMNIGNMDNLDQKMNKNFNNNNNNGNINFNNNNGNDMNNFNNKVREQNENKIMDQNIRDLDFDLEDGDNFKIDAQEADNPYERGGNDNKNQNKVEDNGSNLKNNDDEWDF